MITMTIAICTRNRAFILGEALDSLIPQIQGREEAVELLVVDNASDDGTRALVESRMVRHPFIRYVHEPRVGLSIARNTAWQVSPHADWIFYMDDDAKACPDLVEQSLRVIREGKYDCFGGTYYAWFPFGRPMWLPKDFGTKPLISDIESLIIPDENCLSGNIICFARLLLLRLDGFNPSLGMSDDIGYGEEDELQMRVFNNGGRIGFVPDLFIWHAVLSHKLNVSWHIRSRYKKGYYRQALQNKDSLPLIFYLFVSSIVKSFLFRFPLNIWRMIFLKKGCMRAGVADIISPPAYYLGRIIYKFKFM